MVEHIRRPRPESYAGSLAMVAVALAIGLVLQQFLGITNVALVFLTAVLTASITYGLWPALFASLVSVLAFNFFFLPPLYTLQIADRENVNACSSSRSSRSSRATDGTGTGPGVGRAGARQGDRGFSICSAASSRVS
jgi:hypothetical protein